MAKKDFQEVTFNSFIIAVAALLILTFYMIFAANSIAFSSSVPEPIFITSMILIIIEITLLAIFASIRKIEYAVRKK